jgi:hypothetical protein
MIMKKYLILICCGILMTGCSKRNFRGSEISDCRFISNIVNYIGIVDELPCMGKINLLVDTIDLSYQYTHYFGKRKSIKNWNFSNCNDFLIEGNTHIIYRDMKYEIMHSGIDDLRIYPPADDDCFSLVISNLYNYENHSLLELMIENHSKYRYSGTFIFDTDQNTIDKVQILRYNPNQNSRTGKNLKNTLPIQILKEHE